MSAPLHGIRVVEIASFVAAPSAGLTLAQLGAEVIRVDPVGGGPDIHRWPVTSEGQSLYWAGLNRGKSSVALDLRSGSGQEIVRRLLDEPGPGSGILVTNMRDKDWLSDASLRQSRPDLIHVRVLGHRDGSAAVDYTVNASTGLPFATGAEGAAPTNHAVPVWDLLTGMYAATAILAALVRRDRTGAGTYATVSLDDVAASTLTTLGFVPEAQLSGVSRPQVGNAVYGTFGAEMFLADGTRILVVALTPRHWRDLLSMTGTEQVIQLLERQLGVDFADEGARFEHRHKLTALLRPWFATRTVQEVAEDLDATSVLWAPFRRLTDLAQELVAGAASPVVAVTEDERLGPILGTSGPIRRPLEDPPSPNHAPLVGEHTEFWLRHVGAVSESDTHGRTGMTGIESLRQLTGDEHSWRQGEEHARGTADRHTMAMLADCLDGPDVAGVVPVMWLMAAFHTWPRLAVLGEDGHPLEGLGYPPIPDRRRLFAGGRCEPLRTLPVGELVTRSTRVVSAAATAGRSGPRLTVTLEHRYCDGQGECVALEQQDIAYRPDSSPPLAAQPTLGADQVARIGANPVALVADPLRLFRFSLITGNSHRIHFDQAFAIDHESLPGVLVHGPLLALLMLEIPRRHAPDLAIASFDYRVRRPVLAGSRLVASVEHAEDREWALSVTVAGQRVANGLVRFHEA